MKYLDLGLSANAFSLFINDNPAGNTLGTEY